MPFNNSLHDLIQFLLFKSLKVKIPLSTYALTGSRSGEGRRGRGRGKSLPLLSLYYLGSRGLWGRVWIWVRCRIISTIKRIPAKPGLERTFGLDRPERKAKGTKKLVSKVVTDFIFKHDFYCLNSWAHAQVWTILYLIFTYIKWSRLVSEGFNLIYKLTSLLIFLHRGMWNHLLRRGYFN